MNVAELQDSERYEKLLEIRHQEMAPFIYEYYFRGRSLFLWSHYLLTLAPLAGLVALLIATRMPFPQWIGQASWGVLAFLPLLLVHELLHGLTYKLMGAPQLRFGWSWRYLYAYALAPGFVIDGRQLVILALTPLVLLNSLILLALPILPGWRVALLTLLFLHTQGTAGDWAIIRYTRLQNQRHLYTYDEEGASYFYARRDVADTLEAFNGSNHSLL